MVVPDSVAVNRINFVVTEMNSLIAFLFWIFYEVKIFVIFLFFRNEPATGTLVNGVLSAVFAFLVLCIVLVKPRRPDTPLKMAFSAKLVLAFLCWAGMTVLWTHADSKFIAFGYWGAMALDVSVIYFLLRTTHVQQIAVASLKGIVCGAFILAIVALYFTASKGINRLGDATFLHPNSIGHQVALGSLLSIYLAMHKATGTVSRICWFAVAMSLIFCLLQTLSKTSIVAFAISCLVFVTQSTTSLTKKVLMLSGIASITAISYALIAMYLEQYLASDGGKTATTLSGRTELWETAWKLIKENPIVGYGLLSFRDYLPKVSHMQAPHAHNEWLNAWFQYGVVGVALVTMIYISFYTLARRAARISCLQQESTLAFVLLLFVLVRGVTEAHITSLVFPLPLMMLMIGLLTSVGVCEMPTPHVAESSGHS